MIPLASYYHGCLRFLDKNEAYMPDRVARQFGRVQGIPSNVIPMEASSKLHYNARAYKKVYPNSDYMFTQFQIHSYDPDQIGIEARISHMSSLDYLPWYSSRSHLKVHNPLHGPNTSSTTTLYSASQ